MEQQRFDGINRIPVKMVLCGFLAGMGLKLDGRFICPFIRSQDRTNKFVSFKSSRLGSAVIRFAEQKNLLSVIEAIKKEVGKMITAVRVKELIFESLNKLKKMEGDLPDFEIHDDMVLLGMGSQLDSIAFVTFISDLEERIEDDLREKEFAIKLYEIHDMNVIKDALILKDLAHLLTEIIELDYGNR